MDIAKKIEFAREVHKSIYVTRKRLDDLKADAFWIPGSKSSGYLIVSDEGAFLYRPSTFPPAKVVEEYVRGIRSKKD